LERVIRLKCSKGSTDDLILQANNDKDFDEWIEAFKNFKLKFNNAKDKRLNRLINFKK